MPSARKLAVPVFDERRGPKDSDFNDMARLYGLDAVRECIERADYVKAPKETAPEPYALTPLLRAIDTGGGKPSRTLAAVDEAAAAEDAAEDGIEDEIEADETSSAGDDATTARASAMRAILIDGQDEKSIEWRIKTAVAAA